MAITPENYLPIVKSELRVDTTVDDERLCRMISEAVEYLQKFKEKTLVDDTDDIEITTETTLGILDIKAVVLYCHIYYDGRTEMQDQLNYVVTMVEDKAVQ